MIINQQNIAIVLNEPYPQGMACSRRIHLYAKGLTEHGDNVNIVIPKGQEKGNVLNKNIKGEFQGVKYRYACKNTQRHKNVLIRKINDLLDPIHAFYILLKLRPQKIILVSNQWYQIILYKLLSLLLKAGYYREKSEVPFYEKEKLNWIEKVEIYFSFSMFDGIIVVSNPLKNFFEKEVKVNSCAFVVPIIQEILPIELKKNNSVINHSVLYSGSLLEHKDGISSIIKAISVVKNMIPDIKLFITGNASSSPDYKRVTELIQQLKLSSNVVFTGYLSTKEFDDLMHEVKILISAKPNNRQNQYNFPTKLGEYLATGIPVLSTKFNAIENYLTENKHIFYTKEDYQSISNSIIEIFENYPQAEKVGNNGKAIADKEFNYKYQTKQLRKFLCNEK